MMNEYDFIAPCNSCVHRKREEYTVEPANKELAERYNLKPTKVIGYHRECIDISDPICPFTMFDTCSNMACPYIERTYTTMIGGESVKYTWCRYAHHCGACITPAYMPHEEATYTPLAETDFADPCADCPHPSQPEFYEQCEDCDTPGMGCDDCQCYENGCCPGCPNADK